MDALIAIVSIVSLLGVFAILASVFGAESRDGFDRSHTDRGHRGPSFG